MATPVTDLHARLRGAGLSEPQADAVAAGFESIDRRMGELECRLDRIDVRLDRLDARLDRLAGRTGVLMTLQGATIALIIGLILAPYFGLLFGVGAY